MSEVFLKADIRTLQNEIDRLKAREKKLIEVLEFYGDYDNWIEGEVIRNIMPNDSWNGSSGLKAREILKELEEEK